MHKKTENEESKLNEIHNYIDNIKRYAYKDVYHLENHVLNKNSFTSDFIKNYLFDDSHNSPTIVFIVKNFIIFYIKNFIKFFMYLLNFILYKFKFNKKTNFTNDLVLIDTFFLVDKIISEKQFNERYFKGLYDVLDKYDMKYVFLPRLYGLGENPFKMNKLLDILNYSKKDFLFEYELLSVSDLLHIFVFILRYPFKTINLLQKNNNNNLDNLFNYEIIKSLSNSSFNSYIRYLFGKKITEKLTSNSKILSWQEFQNLEKTFYRAINESEKKIKTYGCQFFIQYKNFIGIHIRDIDYELNLTPNVVLLNGKYNYNLSKKQPFKDGVSLRYKNIFDTHIHNQHGKYILVLLTYEIEESKRLLSLLNDINEEIKIKIHPATDKKQFANYVKTNWKFTNTNLYSLFPDVKVVVVGLLSGTGLEAVACGLTVIIIASKDKIISNPLLSYGKGKIWDIAFTKNEVNKQYHELMKYRKNNIDEIQKISTWYRENFFIEPTEENIIKAFDLNKEILL